MNFLRGLNSCFPSNRVSQEEIIDLSKNIFKKNKDFSKMLKVYKNSGVNSRFLINDLNWYKKKHTWKERNFLFKKNSIELLYKSISITLDKSKIAPEKIGGIVFINTTGIATPSMDAEIINLFNFKNDVKRLPIFGYGCAGGVLGLNRAIDLFKCIKKPILVCNVELCSLTFRPQIFSKANIVSTALFGDGASTYLIDSFGDCKIQKSMDYTWKNTLNLMGWTIEEDGLAVVFDKVIPNFISKELPLILNAFTAQKNLGYILHPGGMKIINAYKDILNTHESIEVSEYTLSKYGNVSSVSVLLVLEEILKRKNYGTFLMSALGPGFSLGLAKVVIENAN